MKNKKIRADLISDKIRGIIDAINIVGDNLPAEYKDFISMGLSKDGLYKKLEFAIESIIDICNIINSDLEFGAPEDEDQILLHLKNHKIIDEKIIELIFELKKFRNVLVHRYGEIDDKKAYAEIKEGINDFEKIIKEFEKFIKNSK